MDEKDKAERSFPKDFNDYDQTVDVVSCWQALAGTLFKKSHFFRFGKFQNVEKIEVTPDFALTESKDGRQAARGALICDVKKLPNPYLQGADATQQELAYRIFGNSIEEVFKYGTKLTYISGSVQESDEPPDFSEVSASS